MGFVQPWALLALPLALLPFLLERIARRRAEPVRFSSLYLLERARRSPSRRARSPARWAALLRSLAIGLLVAAAARPVAPGGGDPAAHRPTRLVVTVDVSASVRQRADGRTAWEAIRAQADSLLALAGPDDEVALAAIADRVVGWWEGAPTDLRRRLARLEPTARPSDWPAALEALGSRLDDSTEAYLLTDGARGARPPDAAAPGSDDRVGSPAPARRSSYRALWVWPAPAEGNRALAAARAAGADGVAVEAWGWGPGVPSAAMVGRLVDGSVREAVAVQVAARGAGPTAAASLGGATTPAGGAIWTVADTATFAFAAPDRHPFDDRRWAARGGPAGRYRVVRWTPPDEPPEPAALFWEAALAASPRGADVGRAASLEALVAEPPELALLPLRSYGAAEAGLLAELAARGTRLLFAPGCPDPACVPPGGWLPHPALPVPDLAWSLGPAERQASLAPRPEGGAAPAVPEHLLGDVPVRGALRASGGPVPEVSWRLSSGAAAFWARGATAIWLVPLGPPVTRLGTTPVFPLVAEAALGGWDARWGSGGAEARVGEPLPAPAGSTVTGPLHARSPRAWTVAGGGAPPRPEEPGLYRIDVRGAGTGASFVAVNADPAEGDLTPIAAVTWRAAWGAAPTRASDWRAALFPRRRGPELWPWALALALVALAAEAGVRRARAED